MKPHIILKPFNGSQTGNDSVSFVPGPNPVLLSDALAAIVVPEGWATLAGPDRLSGGPYPELIEDVTAPAVLVEADPVETRETKVISPAETKPMDYAAMPHKELLAMAKKRGLALKFGQSKDSLVAALSAEA